MVSRSRFRSAMPPSALRLGACFTRAPIPLPLKRLTSVLERPLAADHEAVEKMLFRKRSSRQAATAKTTHGASEGLENIRAHGEWVRLRISVCRSFDIPGGICMEERDARRDDRRSKGDGIAVVGVNSE